MSNKLIFFLALTAVYCIGCNQRSVKYDFDKTKQPIAFAVSQIDETFENESANLFYDKFVFKQEGNANEAYSITVEGKNVQIVSGGVNGLMYGGLEVAEQIELYGKVENTKHKPLIKKRGLKINIPLDARTPGYDDTGDAAQKNMLSMWDWNFWQEYLDKMAMNRYNVLTLWNPHPFPSMIKLKNYPDVALDNVCQTTLEPTGVENEWAEPQMVSRNVVENLKVIKEITIDQKIAFWKKVMQYAHDRGIAIYFFNWNLCANGAARPVEPFYRTYGQPLWKEEPGKYGINNQMDNPINVAYYRECVKTFLETYPHVKGIGVTAGEHMMDDAGLYTREQWIWETYGMGIQDAKKEDPDREFDFIHRVWNTDMDKIFYYWKDYPDSFEASFKYAKARLYSTPKPPFADKHIQSMEKYGLKSWWNLRNDDIFVHRWGDPEYVRDFVKHMSGEHTAGFYMGSDGYVWGREFNSKNAELAGQLEFDKHWYKFMLWGRLAFNVDLSSDFFINKLDKKYPETDAKKMYQAWKTSSKIIPAVNRFHWNDWDYQWSVEACFDARNGFHDVERFMNNPTLKDSKMWNPQQLAKNRSKALQDEHTTPFEVAEELQRLANESISLVKDLKNESNSLELNILLDDIMSMSYLGLYYSSKIDAAGFLALYLERKDISWKEKAIKQLENAVDHWKDYAQIMDKNYYPQRLARTGNFDVLEILEEVEADVEKAKSF